MIVDSKYIDLKAPFKNTQQTHVLKVRNDLEEPIAFKVKTTAPKLYCVRPNSGILKKGEEGEITIIFQGLNEEPNIGSKCKDKFLIVSVPVNEGFKDGKLVSSEWDKLVAAAGGNSKDVKLKVVYNFDSPMNTIAEEDHSVASVAPAVAVTPAVGTIPATPATPVTPKVAIPEKVIAPVTSEVEKKVSEKSISEDNVKSAATTTTTTTTTTTKTTSGGVNVYTLAALALLIAFIVSRLL